MDPLENKLSELLKKDTWTEEERSWMLNFLEGPNVNQLQKLMQRQFDEDGLEVQIHPDLSQQMLHGIHEKLGLENLRKKPSVISMWVRRMAIAASVVFLIGLGWIFFFDKKTESPLSENTRKTTDSLNFIVRHEINTTGKEKSIQIADGSIILLTNNSEITYREPFTTSRDILLNGKAYFKVAKDRTKPFIVTSGEITTTALGTEFSVTTMRNSRQIFVRLYEGSVVVKAVDKTNTKMRKDIYLLPGQEFVYGDKVFVRAFKFKNTVPEQIINDEVTRDNPSLPDDAAPYFMFNNESLSGVLDYLGALYNVRIVYDKKDVLNIYWTGKYDKSESLETILKRIATIHNLTITRKDSAFVISR